MKLIRLFSKILLVVVILGVLLGSLVFIPDVQTWLVRRELAKHPGLHLTVGTVSARFGKVEIEDLRFELGGAVLTIPFLEGRLPLIAAARGGNFSLQRLVAKGWTLDLHPAPDEANASAEVATPAESAGDSAPAAPVGPSPAQSAAYVFNGLLRGWKFPCDLSAEGIELEGDVMIPLGGGNARAPVHLVIQGGGIAAGHEGVLAIDASGTFIQPEIIDLGTHGSLTVSMDTPRTLNRVEWKTVLSAKSDSFPAGFALAMNLTAKRTPAEETYSVDFSREDRHWVTLLAHFREATHQLDGTWKIDLRDSDFGPLLAAHPVPATAAAGEGEFDTDTTFARAHVLGHLSIVPSHLGMLARPLKQLGSVVLNTRFDATQSGLSTRVDQLSLSLDAVHPVASAQSLQAFTIDLTTGSWVVANPSDNWLTGSLHAFPLNSLPELAAGLRLASGDLSGEFEIRASDRGFVFHSKAPFAATNVTVQQDAKVVARDLDLSVSVLAEQTSNGWQLQSLPLTISSAGRPIATFETKASQPAKAASPITLTGKWHADLEALSAQPGLISLREISARSASGDFSATLAGRAKMESNLTVIQQDEAHSIAVKLTAETGSDHVLTFRAPIKVASGSEVLELTTEGSWLDTRGIRQISVKIAGKDVDVEHLRLLGPPIALIFGQPSSAGPSTVPRELLSAPALRDLVPFWGNIVGRVYLAFDKLKAGNTDFQEVRGTFKFSPGSIQLETGQYQLAVAPLSSTPPGKEGAPVVHQWLGAAEGSLTFDPKAEVPYHLKGTLDNGEIDAASVFPAPPAGEDPPFHGRFSVASTLQGNGINLNDLVAHTQQEFRLKSTGGIVRLLKTHLTGLTQDKDKESTAGNVADTVGTLVGKLAGIQKNSTGLGKIRLSKTTEAVLNFSYQVAEIGYNEITLTATRGIDGNLHLVELAMITPDEHVTGSGEITYVKGLSPVAEPLNVELKFGVRDQTAELLANTGLLSSEKDSLGYTLFKQPVHFSGTLQHLDLSHWHDLLFEAATRKPEPEPSKRP